MFSPTCVLTLLLCLALTSFYSQVHSATFSNLQITSQPTVYEKFEISFDLKPTQGDTYSNPYDPKIVTVTSSFNAPNGREYLANCFYYRNFTRSGSLGHQILTPGIFKWLCRFSPNMPGTWNFVLQAAEGKNVFIYPRTSFVVREESHDGFIRISPKDPNYFVHEKDGSTFFPIGENLCWAKDTFDYERYLHKLNENNATYIRIWMSSWLFGIETEQTGLGDYDKSQDQAWQLDYVFDLSRELGIRIMLCLDYALAFSDPSGDSGWKINPYNKAIGGVLNSPDELWTSDEAFAYFSRRLRYIASRWGYATNLLSWELWNEVDDTFNYNSHISDVTAWHVKSYGVVRNADVHKHLITTSFGYFPGDIATWQNLDYLQIHFYNAGDMAEMALTTIPSLRAMVPKKPIYIAEFGTDWNWNHPSLLTNDKTGINIHNEQWASLVVSASGGGYSWWWDNIIDPDNQYYNYKGIAAFVNGENLDNQNYKSVPLDVTTTVRANASVIPLIGWGVKAPENLFTLQPNGQVTPSTVSLSEFQYGVSAHTELRNPPTFIANFEADGHFSMLISGVSPTGAIAEISIDGKVIQRKTLLPNSNDWMSIPVPAGSHKIFVNSVGSDWYQATLFQFSSAIYALQGYGLVGDSKVLAWVRSRTHTWSQVKQGVVQPVISDGKVSLNVCSTSMSWNYFWWNTVSGTVHSSGSVSCSCGGDGCLKLDVPYIDGKVSFDWGLKLLKR